MKRAPCAQVAPSEVSREDENLLSILQYSVIDADILTFRIFGVDHLLFLFSAEDRNHLLKHICNQRTIHTESIYDSSDIPYEDACIPEVIIVSDILLSSLQIRFLSERIDHENLSVAHTLLCEVRLNIAIASLRACRLHSECEYSIRLACKLECGSDDTLEFRDIHDDMVTWRDDDIGIRILSLDSPTDISYARRSVASARLAKYVRCRNIRQLLLYLIDINSISHHPNILWRAYSGKSVVCKLEQCASHAENIYELFRVFFRAHRPESASYAASHNDEMIVIIVHFVESFFVKILITKAITLSMCEAST